MPAIKKSSNLAHVSDYDPASKSFVLTFHNGSRYKVSAPEFHHRNLLKARSAGGYFHSRLKGTFPIERIGE